MNKMYLDIGVAYALEGDVREKALSLAERIRASVPTEYVLDRDRIPHITLFQGRIRLSMLRKVRSLVKLFAQMPRAPLCTLRERLRVRSSGNVYWDAVKNPTLQDHHEGLSANLVPLTEGLMIDHYREIAEDESVDPVKRQVVADYGFSVAGPLYEPHVTLARISDLSDSAAVEDIFDNSVTFTPPSVVIGKLGLYGDIIELLERYPQRAV